MGIAELCKPIQRLIQPAAVCEQWDFQWADNTRYLFGSNAIETRKQWSTVLFFAGYSVWLIWKFINITMFSLPEGSAFHTLMHIISLILLGISCLVSLAFDGRMAIATCFLALGCAVKVAADDVTLIDLGIILYASGVTSFRKIAKYTILVLSVGALIVVASSQIGIIPDYLFSRGGELSRHGLGFLYSTNLSHLYLNIVLLYLFIRRNSLHIAEYLGIVVIDVSIFLLTDSRNSCGLVIAALVLSAILRVALSMRVDCLIRVLRGLTRISFILFTLLSLFAALNYNPSSSMWMAINRITSNRIAQDQAAFSKYGVKPFGQEIEFANRTIAMGETEKTQQELNPEGDTNIVESSFLNILINRGYVTLIVILVWFWLALRKNDDPLLDLIMLVIAAHSAFDFQLINLLYTTFLFPMWSLLAVQADEGGCGRLVRRLADGLLHR